MLGKETFGLNKGEYADKLGRIINNFPVNSRLIGEPREFVLRSCRLVQTWEKLANDPEVRLYVRNISIAGGRKVKLLSLELNHTKQPVPKNKLMDALFPPKKIKSSATSEESHYNKVKSAMRFGVGDQLKDFRSKAKLPTVCYISGKELRRGNRIDVDHVGMSFSEIADSFLASEGLVYTDVYLVGPPTAKRFKDPFLWERWQSFHKEKAQFSLVCASANRSKGAGDYKTPESLYGSFSREDPEDLALDF